ncbi:MAG: hypothetical protein KME54_25000 [Tolypothrix brevis GSE-NOS-MK-07-07A]|nr:hypothetical protein [Tolypothrix brevis GSE-NOS-MK-07-07A]
MASPRQIQQPKEAIALFKRGNFKRSHREQKFFVSRVTWLISANTQFS